MVALYQSLPSAALSSFWSANPTQGDRRRGPEREEGWTPQFVPVHSAAVEVTATRLAQQVAGQSAKAVAASISRLVTAGEIAPGSRLPTVRALAKALGVSPTTVNQAWQALGRAGVLETRGRNGSYVRPEPAVHGPQRYRRMNARPGPLDLDLSLGTPDPALLPDLAPVLARVAARPLPQGYLVDPVLPALEEHLARRWPFPPGALTVVDGAMDALDRLTALTVRLGDVVLVEEAVFPPVLDLLELVGAEVVPIAMDGEGMVPAALARSLARRPVAVYVQPRAHNPLGVSTTSARAEVLATLLAPSGAWVFEDDHAGDISTSPLASLGAHLPERTVLVQSFSKSYGPDLRLAAVGGPRDLVSELVARRLLGAGWSSRLLQGALLELLHTEAKAGLLARARAAYSARRAEVVEALEARGVATTGRDGINLWVEVADEQSTAYRLAAKGVGVALGSPFVPGRPARDHIRITTGLVRDGGVSALADLVAESAAPPSPRVRGW
jgi:DNA-binding transcriptional MocR family regulator